MRSKIIRVRVKCQGHSGVRGNMPTVLCAFLTMEKNCILLQSVHLMEKANLKRDLLYGKLKGLKADMECPNNWVPCLAMKKRNIWQTYQIRVIFILITESPLMETYSEKPVTYDEIIAKKKGHIYGWGADIYWVSTEVIAEHRQ